MNPPSPPGRDFGQLDLLVLVAYLAGVLAIGIVCGKQNKNADEMFAAGGRSPWWVSGISAFMTMFSAGTFVVWGGIAYRYGMTAVAINVCYGVSALLVGWTVAARWRRLGVRTPAEYVTLRFGRGALHMYTWALLCFKVVSSAVALYSLAVLTVAVLEGSGGSAGVAPGGALPFAIVALGVIIVAYTMIGGLWGVLMTDFLQFLVLTGTVLVVVPLAFWQVGGVSAWVGQTPDGFLSPVAGDYTWFFLCGWVVIHYFIVGAEWAFVQRFLCVPTERDAQKAAYLFGLLYLVSPMLWLLPPMIYRVLRPPVAGADPEALVAAAETAYIEVCHEVLPGGLLGLAVAAMFSATASMLSSQLNVFAGVLTSDIVRPLLGPEASEQSLVRWGRATTALLGVGVVLLALAIPTMGGAEAVIVSATSLAVVPLLAPLLVGLVCKRLPASATWVTASVCCLLIVWVKLLAPLDRTAAWNGPIVALQRFAENVGCSMDLILGVVAPAAVLTAFYAGSRGTSPGWTSLRTAVGPSTRH